MDISSGITTVGRAASNRTLSILSIIKITTEHNRIYLEATNLACLCWIGKLLLAVNHNAETIKTHRGNFLRRSTVGKKGTNLEAGIASAVLFLM